MKASTRIWQKVAAVGFVKRVVRYAVILCSDAPALPALLLLCFSNSGAYAADAAVTQFSVTTKLKGAIDFGSPDGLDFSPEFKLPLGEFIPAPGADPFIIYIDNARLRAGPAYNLAFANAPGTGTIELLSAEINQGSSDSSAQFNPATQVLKFETFVLGDTAVYEATFKLVSTDPIRFEIQTLEQLSDSDFELAGMAVGMTPTFELVYSGDLNPDRLILVDGGTVRLGNLDGELRERRDGEWELTINDQSEFEFRRDAGCAWFCGEYNHFGDEGTLQIVPQAGSENLELSGEYDYLLSALPGRGGPAQCAQYSPGRGHCWLEDPAVPDLSFALQDGCDLNSHAWLTIVVHSRDIESIELENRDLNTARAYDIMNSAGWPAIVGPFELPDGDGGWRFTDLAAAPCDQ